MGEGALRGLAPVLMVADLRGLLTKEGLAGGVTAELGGGLGGDDVFMFGSMDCKAAIRRYTRSVSGDNHLWQSRSKRKSSQKIGSTFSMCLRRI